ncbi:16335_t:CDS:2 [Acaulospora colombiana]|uniref:16335_t:CDS:1 n=1 Tax=Acaulospora colombiana TaxID=27376 RepID=A0ACA9KJM5_9GLOM|nr:16335_t:CDS:2 [Acaulospora colombiana]
MSISLGLHRSDYLLHVSPNADEAHIKQVEFNTIASSFSSLTFLTGDLHKYLSKSTNYLQSLDVKALPSNESMTSLPRGIAKAHQLYGSKSHEVHLIRRTLLDIYHEGKLDPKTKALTMYEILLTQYNPRNIINSHKDVSKKVISHRYIANPQEVEKLRSCFTGLYSLDSSPEGEKTVKAALENPERYVMKPQREGGGNNVYAQDIPPILSKLTPSERSSYILMDLIQPPPMRNILLKQGEVIEDDVVSELGVYGIIIGKGEEEIVNEVGGHLLRTKGRETNEGGIAKGFAVLDSPLLF